MKEQTVEVDGGSITSWQVTLEVTFVLDDGQAARVEG